MCYVCVVSVCSYMGLFVCIRKPTNNICSSVRQESARWQPCKHNVPTLNSLWCSCCSHMPLIPSACEVQGPLQLCLRSGAVGGLLTCRHGAFHCQCLPIPSHLRSLADPATPTTLLRKHCSPTVQHRLTQRRGMTERMWFAALKCTLITTVHC